MNKYLIYKPRFNGSFLKHNLPPRMKDGAHAINLDDKKVKKHTEF